MCEDQTHGRGVVRADGGRAGEPGDAQLNGNRHGEPRPPSDSSFGALLPMTPSATFVP